MKLKKINLYKKKTKNLYKKDDTKFEILQIEKEDQTLKVLNKLYAK